MHAPLPSPDLLIIGDEIESILTAVSAAWSVQNKPLKVVLVRRATGSLGGLSTRGGLSYMDITPDYMSPLFKRFLQETDVKRVALHPSKAHQVLERWLDKHHIEVISGVSAQPHLRNNTTVEGITLTSVETGDSQRLQARFIIDTTPDADFARACGIPYTKGLGGLFGSAHNFLGFSPVFELTGVSRADLIAFEKSIRETLSTRSDVDTYLAQALPYHTPDQRKDYLTRPVYSPDELDYIDILNPLIGVAFHEWQNGRIDDYATTPIRIDGGNVSRLMHTPNNTTVLPESFGFNGLVAQAHLEAHPFEQLLYFSQGGTTPAYLTDTMKQFEHFLQQQAGFHTARVIPPQELYVRQTLNLHSRKTMTAKDMLLGGVCEQEAIGTYSYWLDVRGITLSEHYPEDTALINGHLPKPIFNVGLDVAFPPANHPISNLSFVSRAAGYSPLGQGTGRIIQHNAMLGEALGLSVQQYLLTGEFPEIAALRNQLAHRAGESIDITGHATINPADSETSALLAQDRQLSSR